MQSWFSPDAMLWELELWQALMAEPPHQIIHTYLLSCSLDWLGQPCTLCEPLGVCVLCLGGVQRVLCRALVGCRGC